MPQSTINYTLLRLTDEFRALADAHLMLDDFEYGNFLKIVQSNSLNYKSLLMNVNNANINESYVIMSVELMVMDKVFKDIEDRDDVESDTLSILADVFSIVSYSNRWQDFSKMSNQTPARKFISKGEDQVTGWGMTFDLSLKRRNGICDVPMEGYDYEGDYAPICAGVSIFEDDIFIETVPSGGTYSYSSGGGIPVDTDFNGVPTGVDTPAGQNLQLAVINSAPALIGVLIQNTANTKGIQIPDSVVTLNGVAMQPVLASDTRAYTVENQGGVPLGSQKDSYTWEINTDDDILVHYVRPALYDVASMGLNHDQKWHFDNGTFDYTIPAGTKPQQLDPVNADMLLYDNVWGHKFRFVGSTGGYYQESDATYRDVDGNVSDRDTEFLLSGGYYIIDEYTGLGYRGVRGGSTNLTNQLAAQPRSYSGFNDFYSPTRNMIMGLFRVDKTLQLYLSSRPPFDIQLTLWTCSPYNNNPTSQGWSMATTGTISITSFTTNRAEISVRAHYT